MFESSESGGVVIAGSRSGIRLGRIAYYSDANYPRYSTLIEVQAGPFKGAIADEFSVASYHQFLSQLKLLHDKLSGSASLESYEGNHLVLDGNGKGGISVSVLLVGEHVPPIQLRFEFHIDQSYLPKIISAAESEFLQRS